MIAAAFSTRSIAPSSDSTRRTVSATARASVTSTG